MKDTHPAWGDVKVEPLERIPAEQEQAYEEDSLCHLRG